MIFSEPKSIPVGSDRKSLAPSVTKLSAPITGTRLFPMNVYILLFAESLISIVVSLAVLYVLSGPLINVLGRICPDEQAAVFWLSYTKVMLMIAPFLLVLLVDFFTRFSDPMDSLRLALMAVLAGLLFGLHAIGKRVGQFVTVPNKAGGAS